MGLNPKLIFVLLLISCLSVCAKKKMVVHMIPHSHNDAGWLLPFEGYYKNTTEQTLTTVVDSLLSNQKYTFHWADIGFFNRWWNDQSDKRKSDVKKLVDEGRFIFINGGWVINDEALPAYKETMTQMRTGLDFIKENFGVRPSIGWQIDPFGSTAMTAAVFHKLGYSAFIENRISNDFKDILRKKDGYSFFWQAHQVDEDKTEDRIMTYILQFFYTLPGLRLDDGFINTRKSSYVAQFWDKKVQPIVDSLNNLTHSGISEYHVMAACGDDFAFHRGKDVYKAFDDLTGELVKTGKNKGYDIEVKYSNLYTYFDEMKKLDVTYGLFTGDFMPYQELWPGWSWNDFWTGYYSTRLHMKRYIRDTFNKLQSVQSLLAIKAIDANNGSVKLAAGDEIVVDQVNNLLTEARQRWSIMMHHDAITGTHTKVTEESYYDLLKETNDYLDKAFHLLSHTLGMKAKQNTINKVKSHMDDLSARNVEHYTFVNPTANTRSEVVNITMTDTRTDDDLYGVFVHHTNGTLLNVQAGFITMQDLNTDSHHLQEVRKLFVPIDMPALSHVHVYVMRCGATSSQCQSKGFKLSGISKPLKSNTSRTLANSHYKVTIGGNGQLSEIDNFGSSVKSGFSERFTAFKMSRTRSGLYLFNPRSARVDVRFDETEMWYYEVPGLKSIVQAFHDSAKTKVLKTYSLDQHGLDGVQSQVFIEVQAHSEERWEMFWGLRKDHLSSNNQFKAYNHDSMKLVNRPIYNRHVNFKYTNEHELYGYYTSPCIHGGMMTEETSSNVYQFSWANSNPIGCTFSDKNQVDFMVHRNIANNDNKGVHEMYDDKRATATGIMVRIDRNDGVQQHTYANSVINEPLFQFAETNISKASIIELPEPGSIFDSMFYQQGVNERDGFLYGTIDVVDMKMIRHTILHKYNDYELVMVLRNRFDGYLSVNKSKTQGDEGIFKNKYVDVLKSHLDNDGFKCDPSHKILDGQRYDMEPAEYHVDSSKPSNFHGLAPFELAEFRVVRSATLEALDLRQKQIEGTVDHGGRNLYDEYREYKDISV